MGWTFSHQTKKDLIDELSGDRRFTNYEGRTVTKICLHHKTTKEDDYFVLWTVNYVQVEGEDPTEYIGCDLLMKDTYSTKVSWGYKPMDESMGPCYYSCPLKFLKQVSSGKSVNQEWREKVRQYHKKAK